MFPAVKSRRASVLPRLGGLNILLAKSKEALPGVHRNPARSLWALVIESRQPLFGRARGSRCRRDRRGRPPFTKNIFAAILYRKSESRYGDLSLDEKRSQRARRKAAASRLTRANRRDNTQRQASCEILAGMKGWRPSAIQRLETGSGSLSGRISAAHRIDRPVFSAGPRSPVSRPGDARGRRDSPFSRNEAPRPTGRTEIAQAFQERRYPRS